MHEPNVERMLRSMSSKQFQDWMHYDEIEPFGEWRMDIRFAAVRKTLWDIARDTEKHPEPFKISDFMIDFDVQDEDKKDQQQTSTRVSSPEAVNRVFHILALAAAAGAKDQ